MKTFKELRKELHEASSMRDFGTQGRKSLINTVNNFRNSIGNSMRDFGTQGRKSLINTANNFRNLPPSTILRTISKRIPQVDAAIQFGQLPAVQKFNTDIDTAFNARRNRPPEAFQSKYNRNDSTGREGFNRPGRPDTQSVPVSTQPSKPPASPASSGEINVARNNPPRNADVPKSAPVTVSKPAVSKLVAAKPKTPSIVPPKPDGLKQQVGVTARAVAGPTGTQFQNIARGSKPESGMFKKVGTAPSEPKNLAPQGSVERDTQLAKLGFKKF